MTKERINGCIRTDLKSTQRGDLSQVSEPCRYARKGLTRAFIVLVRAEKRPELPGGRRVLTYNPSIEDLVIGTHSNLGLKMGEARRPASRG